MFGPEEPCFDGQTGEMVLKGQSGAKQSGPQEFCDERGSWGKSMCHRAWTQKGVSINPTFSRIY